MACEDCEYQARLRRDACVKGDVTGWDGDSQMNRTLSPGRLFLFIVVAFLTFHLADRISNTHAVDRAINSYDRTVSSAMTTNPPHQDAISKADQMLQSALSRDSSRRLVVDLCAAAFLCLAWFAVMFTPRDLGARFLRRHSE